MMSHLVNMIITKEMLESIGTIFKLLVYIAFLHTHTKGSDCSYVGTAHPKN